MERVSDLHGSGHCEWDTRVVPVLEPGMHAPPCPGPGKKRLPGPENFQDCPTPKMPQLWLLYRPAPPEDFILCPAPPKPKRNFLCPVLKPKRLPLHPWLEHTASEGSILGKKYITIFSKRVLREAWTNLWACGPVVNSLWACYIAQCKSHLINFSIGKCSNLLTSHFLADIWFLCGGGVGGVA